MISDENKLYNLDIIYKSAAQNHIKKIENSKNIKMFEPEYK